MESFFFNITDTAYKVTQLLDSHHEHITRVDISNGILFLDISLEENEGRVYEIQSLDRMLLITLTKEGALTLNDTESSLSCKIKANSIDMFISAKQNFSICTQKGKKHKIFALFIADFILKRYLSSKKSDPINTLYNKLQREISCEHIDSQSIDAMSLYIIDKIIETDSENLMSSIICEHNILEFLIHRLKLLDIDNETLSDDEICISKSAKEILQRSFATPPTIETLAHLCATNETKLKMVFKKRYKTTIHSYIQKLRLEQANLLLKERFYNIGEISKRVGYKHQGHFSKLFFEHYGVYPKDLLKK